MATVKHACIDCGEVRKVRQDKLAKGQQSRCRKCHAVFTAERRSAAMKRYVEQNKLIHGTQCQLRDRIFMICKTCQRDYEHKAMDDTGYCSDECKGSAYKSGYNFFELNCILLRTNAFTEQGTEPVMTARKQLLTHCRM